MGLLALDFPVLDRPATPPLWQRGGGGTLPSEPPADQPSARFASQVTGYIGFTATAAVVVVV